mgnify:CR=1 FL=1
MVKTLSLLLAKTVALFLDVNGSNMEEMQFYTYKPPRDYKGARIWITWLPVIFRVEVRFNYATVHDLSRKMPVIYFLEETSIFEHL